MTSLIGSPGPWLLTNAVVLNPELGEMVPDRRVLVIDGRIVEVGGNEVTYSGAHVIDLRGATLMPGLIDSHVHVTAASADLGALPDMSPSYTAAHAARALRDMLHRGFTTVRDCGGADFGLANALEDGLIHGPRLRFAGKALSQTGGHGDVRHRGRTHRDDHYCCPDFGRVCDGVDECRRAARDELRKGADHLKIMLSGGVASPTDRIDSTQFSLDEITAIVEEATAARRYVAGHAYLPDAINRGLRCGVRSIEHGNFLDDSSVKLFCEKDSFLVPTLVTYTAIAAEGRAEGMRAESHSKVFDVLEAGKRGLELAHRGGVNVVFGTDLLGGMQRLQLTEFRLRAEVQPAVDIIRSATTTAAKLLGAEGSIGVVAPGSHADLLAVDGDPLADIGRLCEPERFHRLLMANGVVVKLPC